MLRFHCAMVLLPLMSLHAEGAEVLVVTPVIDTAAPAGSAKRRQHSAQNCH
jgi:hypothetical protein